ncbi:MFS transporter [Nonomuraea cavernae]|uniref:MFS transporter n=1 Tax=Nonomuraea cavernae TaxID=2045107 RepID=A0A918DRR7_9ACTN|nr:MFS transporter [Nonomuraea cavernae]MCA2186672.1 MFS transporter [Nonomuraea cavernae]GGO79800.1 MFS transporter [Nonomuraea cavernae]
MSAPWYRNRPLLLLVVGSQLNTIAFFATLPFLTLYLSDISTLNAATIGGVVGSIALIAAFGGFLGGIVADRVGAFTLIRIGLVVYVATYLALALTSRLALVIGLIVLLGVARVLVEPSMKKLLSLASSGSDGIAFRLRYVTLCLGAVVGPLIGAALYAFDAWLIFVLPVVVYLVYLGFLTVNRARLSVLDRGGEREGRDWGHALADRSLLLLIAAGFVIFFVFSQFESIFPLFVKDVRGADAVTYFSVLLAANAALGIVMQFPIAWLARRLPQRTLALIGSAAFAASLLLFSGLPLHWGFAAAGVLLWTVGEAALIPLPDIVIHEITPDSRKGTYFGLAELRYLGFFLGPLAGGALLGIGPSLYFAAMAVFAFGGWLLIRARPDREPEPPGGRDATDDAGREPAGAAGELTGKDRELTGMDRELAGPRLVGKE